MMLKVHVHMTLSEVIVFNSRVYTANHNGRPQIAPLRCYTYRFCQGGRGDGFGEWKKEVGGSSKGSCEAQKCKGGQE